MATWELNTKGISGIAEARELPGLAAKTLVSYCPRCTGSPRWPSAGYLVPTRAPWMRPTCQATSTSSSSGSIVVTPEAEGCFSTVFWNLRSSMHLFDTRTSSPPSVHGQCHLSLHIDEGTHPAWRCLPRTARGGGKPTPVKWRAQCNEIAEVDCGARFGKLSLLIPCRTDIPTSDQIARRRHPARAQFRPARG